MPVKLQPTAGSDRTVETATEELFTPNAIAVLAAIADTFIGPLTAEETSSFLEHYTATVTGPSPASTSALTAYTALAASDLNVAQYLALSLPKSTPKPVLKSVLTILWMLTTRYGTYFLVGGPSMFTPKSFLEMNTEERTKAILSLSQSYLLPLRVLFKTLKGIISRAAYGTLLPDEAGRLTNSAHAAIGYTGAVLDRERPKAADIWKPDFLDVDDLASSKGLADGASLELSCDVVIVGSGAGGGVVAAELATAGYSVLVLDKGTFTHAPDLPLTELESADLLYEQRGLLQSDSGSIFIFAGSVFGGGTYINWSGSLRLPQTVREEWAQKWNLPLFTSAAYNESLDKIEARLGISDARIVHNQPNSILLEGAKKLGYPASAIPQNTGTHEHSCGHCGMGCPFGEKQGTSVTYLHDAARHGAAFVEGCFVERITHENGVATGVTARAGSNKRPLTIRAKRVVCSAGSLSTPPLLQRSGLRNPHIGKHLKVHPVGLVFGVFPDRLIQPFKGSIMTVVCNAVADISGTGYGPLLEIPYMHPSLYSMILPFRSRQDHKRLMTMFDRVVPIIVLLREEDTEGDVWQDEANLLRVNYEIKSRDLDRIAKGMEVATEILVAAGADEIFTPQQDLKAFNVGGGGEAVLETEAYKEFVEEMKRQKWHVPLFCAHQMGSARMSGDKGKGVCNAEGETWEVKGLWVADTSLFPTASGVNPMLTTFSVADMVAQNIKNSLVGS